MWFIAKSFEYGDWHDNVGIAWVRPPPILPKAMEVWQECLRSTCFPCTAVSFSPPAVISLQCRSIMQGFLPRILPFSVWLYGMISYSFQLKVHLGPCWSIFEDSCHEWKTHVFNIWTWLTLFYIVVEFLLEWVYSM